MGGVDSGTSTEEDATQRSMSTLLLSDPRSDGGTPVKRFDVDPDGTNVLVVSTEQSVQAVVDDWNGAAGSLPPKFGLVTFAEFDRSATTADRPSRRTLPGTDVTLTAMSDLQDLKHLGTAITLYLDDWTADDRPTLVYVDALAPFVETNGLESTFQFLHLLVQSVEQLGARLIVRLDPAKVDDRTIHTLRSLFDEVAERDSDESSDVTLEAGTIHDLLANARRRFVLRSLYDEPAMELERLAANLARWEHEANDPPPGERERSYAALASVHLPRLADAGVVSFDRSSGRVRLSTAAREADRIKVLLERAFEE